MLKLRDAAQAACFALLFSAISLAQVGNGTTPDDAAVNALLQTAGKSCATVKLQGTQGNKFLVTKTINVPACVKFVGVFGGIPDEGSASPVGTTLIWGGSGAGPVVSFHDSPGASMSGVSVDCNNNSASNTTIGIQYYSDDKPASSFVNIDTLMIKGCHQAVVMGLPDATPQQTVLQCSKNGMQYGCYEADQFKFERYRIMGDLQDLAGEGFHINSANAAQGSLIADGNIQGDVIGFHIIMTNGGLVIQSSNGMGSPPKGTTPVFLQAESNVAVSPTLVDGCESVTSIGNLGNTNSTVNNSAAHILSLNEGGWSLGNGISAGSLTTLASGGGNFGDTVESHNYLAALAPVCPSPASFPVVPQAGDLVSCESTHGGRLFLGQDLMLLNNGDGTLDTAGLLRIQTGLYQDGSGLKHQTMSTGTVTAGSTVQLPFNWTTTFADLNYQAVCSVQDGSGSLQVVSTAPPAPNAVNVFVKNNDT